MCIIIDANKMGTFLSEPVSTDAAPVHRWLNRGGTVVYSTGGKFDAEIGSSAKAKLTDYVKAGKARFVPPARLAPHLRALTKLTTQSNDEHMLALALASGARLLYTADQALINDFTDHRIVNEPRGKVYKRAAHAALLTKAACRGP